MKFMTPSRRLVVAAALATMAMPTLAATATSTFQVNGTVVATCSVSATALNFGASIPTPVNSNIDATSTITATCSNSVPFSIALNAGNGVGATVITRKMSSGPNAVDYAMYTDAGRTNVWGDGTPGSSVNTLTGTGAAQAIPVYGRIPTGQTPAIGIYSDTILVTLTF
jgi:spore coat protein U-like protein